MLQCRGNQNAVKRVAVNRRQLAGCQSNLYINGNFMNTEVLDVFQEKMFAGIRD